MENNRFCIRPDLQVQDYENFTRLHEKMSKTAMNKINRVSNFILVVLAVLMPLDALVLIVLQRRVSPSSILALVVGAVAIGYLCWHRTLFARMTKKQNEKLASNLEIIVDDDGLHAKNASAESTFAFSTIEEIYCWRECYYLYLDKLRVQLLPFHGFVEGDPAAFGAYIEEKTGLPVQVLSDQLKKER